MMWHIYITAKRGSIDYARRGSMDLMDSRRFSTDSGTSNDSPAVEEEHEEERTDEFNTVLQQYMTKRLPKRRMSTEGQLVMLTCYQVSNLV